MLTHDSNPTCGILYIDDEEKALKYFRMAFSEKFKVFTAPSPKEGLEVLRREAKNIGIVISDQRMPEMLGAELLGIVRDEFPTIVRVLTTAYSDLDSAIQAVNKGHIYQYVVKPWEIPELGMVLQRAADYYQVLSERNELLALKMTTLQRIVCSDRLKWLLLSSRYWNETAQSALRHVLATLVKALPATPKALIFETGKYSTQHFEIGALIRGEYHNALRCLEAVDKARDAQSQPETCLKAFLTALTAKYSLAPDRAELTATGADLQLSLHGEAIPANEFLRTIFGVLFDRETSEISVLLFETLFAVATTHGSLTISGEPTASDGQALSFTFAFPQSAPPSADEIIDELAGKFAQWDISRL